MSQKSVCVCKFYEWKDDKLVCEEKKCKKSDVFKVISSLLVRGYDEYLTPDHMIRVVAKDKYTGETEDFELWENEILEILRGNDEFRREVRREYREFLEDKEIVAIELIDSFFECCWGDREYCLGDENGQ